MALRGIEKASSSAGGLIVMRFEYDNGSSWDNPAVLKPHMKFSDVQGSRVGEVSGSLEGQGFMFMNAWKNIR
jgi:hypothetical protein